MCDDLLGKFKCVREKLLGKELGDPGRKVLDTDAGLTLNEGGKMKEGKLRGSVLDDRAVPREVWQSCWES